jgi:phosphoribosylformylglycinamidine cyclo-ligase
MAAVVAPDAADAALRLLDERGVPAWVLGEITEGTGTAHLD